MPKCSTLIAILRITEDGGALEGEDVEARQGTQGTRHECEGRPRRINRILGRAIVLALVAVVAGPVASALATVSIEVPPSETATNNPQPFFEGHTSDSVDPVTLDIYKGFPASGAPVQAPTTLPVVGTWSLTLASPLADGRLSARRS